MPRKRTGPYKRKASDPATEVIRRYRQYRQEQREAAQKGRNKPGAGPSRPSGSSPLRSAGSASSSFPPPPATLVPKPAARPVWPPLLGDFPMVPSCRCYPYCFHLPSAFIYTFGSIRVVQTNTIVAVRRVHPCLPSASVPRPKSPDERTKEMMQAYQQWLGACAQYSPESLKAAKQRRMREIKDAMMISRVLSD